LDKWIFGYLDKWIRAVGRLPPNNPFIQQSIYPVMFSLALALFVPGIGANDPDHAFAANHFAVFAKLLN
jgi:hypothetical protein